MRNTLAIQRGTTYFGCVRNGSVRNSVVRHEVTFMIVSSYQGGKEKKPVVPPAFPIWLCDGSDAVVQSAGDNVAEEFLRCAP